MMNKQDQKITGEHLKRDAYLYIRQSTLKQVFENTESTKRQYALRDRAVALGWPIERIIIIDSDQAHSGASMADREGFKKLVSEVGMGHAGIVIGIEVSRLARNNADWHRLLEICALTSTLILDEDGLYEPGHFNDRMLLGLKGSFSEAELHMLKARLWGGISAKAKRGELKTGLPVGLVYNAAEKVVLDPDKQVQKSIRLFFKTFRRVGSASATVKYFRKQELKFPRRLRKGPNKGNLVWGKLVNSRALQILHNPRYPGAFFFGRTKMHKHMDGSIRYEKLPSDQWHTLKTDAHEGYISWEEYEENLRRLRENAQANGSDRRKSPPREGPALLQGLVVCGVCGNRMTVHYHARDSKTIPEYLCQKEGIEHGKPICQCIHGKTVDDAIGELLVESVTPMALDVALKVQDEVRARIEEADRLRKQQVERARYEADLARQRFMQVDPNNRFVADSLEAEWNVKLRALAEAQEEYERQCKSDNRILNPEEISKIMALAIDFPRLWNDPKTEYREKKRMVRLLIEDVTLVKDEGITAHIRFRGGAVKSLNLPAPMIGWKRFKTSQEVVRQIDELLDKHTDAEVVDILNKRGEVSGTGQPFNKNIIFTIRKNYCLKSHYERLRERNLFTLDEISDRLKTSKDTLNRWARKNILNSYKANDKNERLYEWPGLELIKKLRETKQQGRRKKFIELLSNRIREVQYEV